MNVRAERGRAEVPAVAAKPVEIVSNFDPELLKAPFLLRCGALLIDYILFISIPVIFLLFGRLLGVDGGKLIPGQLNSAGWLIAVLAALTNFLIFPMFTGQSIGKMLTGLQIVQKDGHSAGFKNLLIRHFVGYPLTILTLGIGFLWAAFNTKGRALHDYIAGTIVVYGKRRFK